MGNEHTTSQPIDEQPIDPPVRFELHVGVEGILLIIGVVWALAARAFNSGVGQKVENLFTSMEEEKRINSVLAKVGTYANAERVLLAIFHNGVIDGLGYHLQRISTVNQYVQTGSPHMNFPINNLPIGKIMNEIEMLNDAPGWVTTSVDGDLPAACVKHLRENNMHQMSNVFIRVGDLPIGIVSVQWLHDPTCEDSLEDPRIEKVLLELQDILARRVTHPTLFKRILNRIRGKSY